MSFDMDDVKAAARRLVKGDDAEDQFKILDAVIRKAAGLPVKLTGRYTPMNPLLQLRQADSPTYDTVMGWVTDKRKQLNLPPLKDEQSEVRREYMREFMAAKRQREGRAVEIENMLRSDNDRLRGTARMEFVRRQSAMWKKERDKLLAAERKAAGTEHIPSDVYSQTLKNFWANVDRQLDEMEELTREEMRRPLTQRAELSPQMRALRDALEGE